MPSKKQHGKLKSSELHRKWKQFGRLLIFHVTIKRAEGVEIEFVNNTDRWIIIARIAGVIKRKTLEIVVARFVRTNVLSIDNYSVHWFHLNEFYNVLILLFCFV